MSTYNSDLLSLNHLLRLQKATALLLSESSQQYSWPYFVKPHILLVGARIRKLLTDWVRHKRPYLEERMCQYMTAVCQMIALGCCDPKESLGDNLGKC